MVRRRTLTDALCVLALAARAAVAQSDTDPILNFNMTFKANEGLLNYNEGWQLQGDQLFWTGESVANATRVNFLYLGFGFCVYGEFDPLMNFTTACGPVVGEWLNNTDGSSFCYTHQWGYFDIGLKGGENGVRRLDSVTFFTGLTAPKGATMNDIDITTVNVLDKGMYKNTSVFDYSGGDIEPCNADSSLQFRSGTFVIRPPRNTSFLVIRGPRGPTLGSVQYTINPFPLPNSSFAVNVNGPVSPSNSPLYNQPLDPWETYTISCTPFPNARGVGFNYTMIDFYSYSPTGNGTAGGKKSNAGAIAGGVVGGVVGLALLAILGWYCFRRRRTPISGITNEDKFQIDVVGDGSVTSFTPEPTDGGYVPRNNSTPISGGSEVAGRGGTANEKMALAANQANTANVSNTSNVSSSEVTPTDTTTESSDSADQLLTLGSSSRNTSRPTSKSSLIAHERNQARTRQLPRHDEDVGALEPVGDSEEEADEDELLPPMYDPSWENGRLRVRNNSGGARAAARVAATLELTCGPRRMSM